MFERLLIDSDWAINNGNWMWLSCSSFFYQAQSPKLFSVQLVKSSKSITIYSPYEMFHFRSFFSHADTCVPTLCDGFSTTASTLLYLLERSMILMGSTLGIFSRY